MARLPVEFRHGHGLASRGRHAEQRALRWRRKQNDAAAFQVPPRAARAVAKVCGARRRGRAASACRSRKRPTERLSGDQNGKRAPSVPASGCAVVAPGTAARAGGAVAGGNEDDLPAVGREGKREGSVVAGVTMSMRVSRRGRRFAQMTQRRNGQGDRNRQHRDGDGNPCQLDPRRVTVAADGPSPAPPSRTRLRSRAAASRDVAQPLLRILLEAAAQQAAGCRRRDAGSSAPVRLALEHCRRACR